MRHVRQRAGRRIACWLTFATLGSVIAEPASSPTPVELAWRGHMVDPVVCDAHPEQSYAIYVPSAYSPEAAWPIVYCFDAAARGHVPVERLRTAAEIHGFIVVASNNSRNGPWPPIVAAAEAMMEDTARRFTIDRRQRYAAGFSGGARAACGIAGAAGFAGVIACSGGFPDSTVPAQVPFLVFATAGYSDFNFEEVYRLGVELERRHVPYRLRFFAGGHDWLPPELADAALAWFELQAVRRGIHAHDAAWIAAQFAARCAETERPTIAADERAAGYRSVIADFDGLIDTRTIEAKANALESSREYRRAIATRERSFRHEADWREQLRSAETPGERSAAPAPHPFGETPRANGAFPGDAAAGGVAADRQPADTWTRRPNFNWTTEDEPFDKLRRLVAYLKRRADREPAAARALSGEFVSCLTDGETLMQRAEPAAAAQAFEAATILSADSSRAYLALAQARLAAGNRRGAREALQAATAKGYADRARVAEIRAAIDGREPPTVARDGTAVGIPAAPTLPTGAAVSAAVRSTPPATETSTVAPPAPTPNFSSVARDFRAAEAADPDTSPRGDAIVLAPLAVHERPFTSFGLSLFISSRPDTRQITRVLVHDVAPNSDAEAKGIRAGDEITRIDGRSVFSLVAEFDRTSEFGHLFIARRTGDRIALEILRPSGDTRRITLEEGLSPQRLVELP